MREVVYKNLTSLMSRKKDVFVQEVFEKDGITARTERRCLYFIRDIMRLEKPDDLKKWVAKQGEVSAADKRQFHIFKKHSDNPGEDRLICKMLGNVYAIVDNTVYVITFLQSFKIYFSKRVPA